MTTSEPNVIPTVEELREAYVSHRRAEGSLFRSADFEFDRCMDAHDVQVRDAALTEAAAAIEDSLDVPILAMAPAVAAIRSLQEGNK